MRKTPAKKLYLRALTKRKRWYSTFCARGNKNTSQTRPLKVRNTSQNMPKKCEITSQQSFFARSCSRVFTPLHDSSCLFMGVHDSSCLITCVHVKSKRFDASYNTSFIYAPQAGSKKSKTLFHAYKKATVVLDNGRLLYCFNCTALRAPHCKRHRKPQLQAVLQTAPAALQTALAALQTAPAVRLLAHFLPARSKNRA